MYRYIVKVDGMKCGSCESYLNNEVRKAIPNVKVKSSRYKKETIIDSDTRLDIEAIKNVITNSHYTYLGVKEEEYFKKSLFAKIFKK